MLSKRLKQLGDKFNAEFTMPFDSGIMLKECGERCMTDPDDIKDFYNSQITQILKDIVEECLPKEIVDMEEFIQTLVGKDSMKAFQIDQLKANIKKYIEE
jgi:hypothetical protein